MTALEGKRILLVEDEAVIAQMASDMIADYGGIVVGPAFDVASALNLIASEALDAAVLDVNLHNERSDRVAAALRGLGVPFIVATGYGAEAAAGFEAAVIDKPYTERTLSSALAAAMARRRPAS